MATTEFSKFIGILSAAPSQHHLSGLAKIRPGADYGSDHELVIAKLRLKLKKVGKNSRSFTYDLNKIPYGYTVEVRNRLNGSDRQSA